jgi:hypothetical protein
MVLCAHRDQNLVLTARSRLVVGAVFLPQEPVGQQHDMAVVFECFHR